MWYTTRGMQRKHQTLKHLPIFLYANSLRFRLCTTIKLILVLVVVVVAIGTIPCHLLVAVILFVIACVMVERFWIDF